MGAKMRRIFASRSEIRPIGASAPSTSSVCKVYSRFGQRHRRIRKMGDPCERRMLM